MGKRSCVSQPRLRSWRKRRAAPSSGQKESLRREQHRPLPPKEKSGCIAAPSRRFPRHRSLRRERTRMADMRFSRFGEGGYFCPSLYSPWERAKSFSHSKYFFNFFLSRFKRREIALGDSPVREAISRSLKPSIFSRRAASVRRSVQRRMVRSLSFSILSRSDSGS